MRIFRLLASYEFFVGSSKEENLIRVEIFEAIGEAQIFRTRVWLQNLYNLYPTMLNFGRNAGDLHRFHSSEHLNAEITLSIADSPDWITGISFLSEAKFLEAIQASVLVFFKKLDRPE